MLQQAAKFLTVFTLCICVENGAFCADTNFFGSVMRAITDLVETPKKKFVGTPEDAYVRGQTALQARKFKAAIKWYSTANLGGHSEAQREFPLVRDCYARPAKDSLWHPLSVEERYQRGRALEKSGSYDWALRFFESANLNTNLMPVEPVSSKWASDGFYWGDCHKKAYLRYERLAEFIANCKTAEGMYELGRRYHRDEHLTWARRCYEKAAQLGHRKALKKLRTLNGEGCSCTIS